MPIQHIVCLKLKAGVTDEQVNQLTDQLRSLRTLEGVLSLEAGKSFTDPPRGEFNYGLIVVLRDKAALDHYQQHPAHIKVRDEFLIPVKENIMAVDFEC